MKICTLFPIGSVVFYNLACSLARKRVKEGLNYICIIEGGVLKFLIRFFTWWNGATLNTLIHTWWKGECVGADRFGNRYYRTRGGKVDPALGFERRWVIFQDQTEASAVPEGWYGWLHHFVDTLPSQEIYLSRPWELPRLPNATGTAQAYQPPASTLGPATFKTPAAYEPWVPHD